MSRTDKFTTHGAFYRSEARPLPGGERWTITVYRNGSVATEFRGPPLALDDRALAAAFEAVRDLADQGIWEPGGRYPQAVTSDGDGPGYSESVPPAAPPHAGHRAAFVFVMLLAIGIFILIRKFG